MGPAESRDGSDINMTAVLCSPVATSHAKYCEITWHCLGYNSLQFYRAGKFQFLNTLVQANYHWKQTTTAISFYVLIEKVLHFCKMRPRLYDEIKQLYI